MGTQKNRLRPSSIEHPKHMLKPVGNTLKNFIYLDLCQPKLWRQKFHSSACNYECNLEKTSNSSQSTCPVGRVLWEELLVEVTLHISHFIVHAFKRLVHVFAGQVKIVSHSSCRTSTILKYFCPLLDLFFANWLDLNLNAFFFYFSQVLLFQEFFLQCQCHQDPTVIQVCYLLYNLCRYLIFHNVPLSPVA